VRRGFAPARTRPWRAAGTRPEAKAWLAGVAEARRNRGALHTMQPAVHLLRRPSLPGSREDFCAVLQLFTQEQPDAARSCTFAALRRAWVRLDMTAVFSYQPPGLSYEDYVQELYATAIALACDDGVHGTSYKPRGKAAGRRGNSGGGSESAPTVPHVVEPRTPLAFRAGALGILCVRTRAGSCENHPPVSWKNQTSGPCECVIYWCHRQRQ
jgi:hypothetical protein